jgi:hypothetical protein
MEAEILDGLSLALIGNASGQTFGAEGILIRGVFDKTSCASGAPASMKIGFSGRLHEKRGSEEGDAARVR